MTEKQMFYALQSTQYVEKRYMGNGKALDIYLSLQGNDLASKLIKGKGKREIEHYFIFQAGKDLLASRGIF